MLHRVRDGVVRVVEVSVLETNIVLKNIFLG